VSIVAAEQAERTLSQGGGSGESVATASTSRISSRFTTTAPTPASGVS